MSLEKEVLLILGAQEGLFKKFSGKSIESWEDDFYTFIDAQYPHLGEKLWKAEAFTDALKQELIGIIKEFTG